MSNKGPVDPCYSTSPARQPLLLDPASPSPEPEAAAGSSSSSPPVTRRLLLLPCSSTAAALRHGSAVAKSSPPTTPRLPPGRPSPRRSRRCEILLPACNPAPPPLLVNGRRPSTRRRRCFVNSLSELLCSTTSRLVDLASPLPKPEAAEGSSSSGDQNSGSDHLRVAGAQPHPSRQAGGVEDERARRRARQRRPEFGRGWVRRYGAREKELVVATGSWCCAEHNGELGFEPLWL